MKHKWSKYIVSKRTKDVLITELKVFTKKDLVKLLCTDITILWRIPQCGELVKREILTIAFNKLAR